MANEVLVDVADGIMTVTLNRPEAKNAANRAVAVGVAAAMDRLDSDDSIRVAILTGAGGTFCAGVHLKAFRRGEMPRVGERSFGCLPEATPRKPLIAAVEAGLKSPGTQPVPVHPSIAPTLQHSAAASLSLHLQPPHLLVDQPAHPRVLEMSVQIDEARHKRRESEVPHRLFRVRGLCQQHQVALREQFGFTRAGRGLHDERGLRVERLFAGSGVGDAMLVIAHLSNIPARFS